MKSNFLLITFIYYVISVACIADTQIVGGNQITSNERESSVAIVYKNKIYCSGVVIHKNWVLTAAHCVFNLNKDLIADVTIHQGNGSDGGLVSKETLSPISKIVIHPQYLVKSVGYFDYALIQMAKPLEVSPSKILLTAKESEELLSSGANVSIVGFGKREVSNDGRPEGLKYEAMTKVITKTSQEILLGKPGVDACQGDSGGGAFVTNSQGDDLLFGIVSRGGQQCDGMANAYWGMTEAVGCWIKEILNDDFSQNLSCENFSEIRETTFKEYCIKNKNSDTLLTLHARYKTKNCKALEKVIRNSEFLDFSRLKLSSDYLLSFFKNIKSVDLSFNQISSFEALLDHPVTSINIYQNNLSFFQVTKLKKLNPNIEINNFFNQSQMMENSQLAKTCSLQDMVDLDTFLSLETMGYDREIKFCMQSAFDFYHLKNEFRYLNPEAQEFEFKLKVLSGMNRLKNITIKNSNIKNFEGLEQLPSLESLNLANNQITDLEDFVELINAEKIGYFSSKIKIDLTNNPIISLEALEKTKKPIELTIFNASNLKCPINKLVSCRF